MKSSTKALSRADVFTDSKRALLDKHRKYREVLTCLMKFVAVLLPLKADVASRQSMSLHDVGTCVRKAAGPRTTCFE